MPTRQLMWNVSGELLMYLLLLPTVAIFAYGIYRRWRLWQLGQREHSASHLGFSLRSLLVNVVLQRRILAYPLSGAMHAAMFAGFGVLFVGTCLVFLQNDLGLPILYGWFYLLFKFALNLFGLLFVVAVLFAVGLRYVRRLPRLQDTRAKGRCDSAIVLALLLSNAVAGFGLQGLRIAVTQEPWAAWEFAGAWLAAALRPFFLPEATLLTVHGVLWWVHLLLAFGLIAYIPYSKLFHIFSSPANVLTRSPGPVGTLPTVDFEQATFLGVSQIEHFRVNDLLQMDACTECGRCEEQCPAFQAGLPLSPRSLVLDLRDHLSTNASSLPWQRTPKRDGLPLIGGTIAEATLWACTTCRACEAICPVLIDHVPKIVAMRRHLTMEQSELPNQAVAVLRSLEARGHPFGSTPYRRADWAKELAVPVLSQCKETPLLYWVGCMGAFDDRAMRVSRAFARLLEAAGVDFAILGNEERCTGDPARRLGNELLFQTLAQENVTLLDGYGVRRIVTTCAHCFNTLKNEYPQFGGHYEVMHHTTLLAQLLHEGRLRPSKRLDALVTYHDPCYLGRYNEVYDDPREVATRAGGRLVEMAAHKARSQCCGAGGGRLWSAGQSEPAINNLRVAQAAATSSATVATACPFCLVMMEDGLRASAGPSPRRAADLAELLEEVL